MVYFKVYYKDNANNFSSAYTSTSLTPLVKQLNFADIIGLAIPPYGCTNVSANFTLSPYTCTNFCATTYTVTTYNITWQAPAGWVQTSISNNGSNVYFTPDATSQGLVTATIHLPCGFTEIKTFNLSRPVTAPTFTQTSVQSCTSTASMSINPTCGAIDYTYSIAGDQGVTFTNSQQIYTTTSTTVALTLPTGASVNSVKAKANYAGSISSTEGNSTLVVGAPQPGTINLQLIDPTFGRIHATIEAVPGAVSYNWYKNSSLVSGYNGTFATIPISRTACDLEYDIAVEAVSSNCGTSTQSHANAYVPCDNYSMSPNPASTSVTIESANSASQSASKSASPTKNAINKVWIMDKMGNVIQQYSYPDLQKVTINISGLKADTYVVKVFNGTNWTSKQLSVLK